MTNYNDGKWHGWNGGECPVHRQSIGDLTYYDGTVYTDVKMSAFGWQEPLMFRVTKGYKEPREFWEKDGRRFYDVKSAILSAGDAEIIHWCEVNEGETEEGEDLVTLIEDAPEDDLFKPCPFCGGRAEHSIGKTSGGKPWHYVECVNCGATAPVPPYADHNIAVIERLAKAWNTRAEILAVLELRGVE